MFLLLKYNIKFLLINNQYGESERDSLLISTNNVFRVYDLTTVRL